MELLLTWLRPEGFIAIGVAISIAQQIRTAWSLKHVKRDVADLAVSAAELKVNTNHIQDALNAANIDKGRIVERDDARERAETGKPP